MRRELERMYDDIALPELGFEQWDPTLLDQTLLSGIQEDPRLRGAQLQALEGFQDIVSQGGLTDVDRARIAEIQMQMDQREKAQRDALMQQMAQRGISGGGQEIAAQMLNQQQAAQTASLAGMQQAANAQMARERALGQLGGLGTQVRGQEYDIAANRARAQDAINQFNTQLQNQAFLRNADERNRLAQQRFQNQMGLNQAREQSMRADLARRLAVAKQGWDYSFGNDEAGAAILGMFSDERLKENINHVGEENGYNVYEFSFIDQPSRFRGVLAQEVLKKNPSAVGEHDGYLTVDYDKIGVNFRKL